MEVINYSKDKFQSLKELNLGRILHTESDLFFVNYKGKEKIFKKLYVNYGENFSNKAYTISSLIDTKDLINIDEIVFPEQVVSISKNVYGYIMPYIKNINFNTYMNLKNKTLKDKIELFRQLNQILLKMKKVREEQNINFYINDLHEDNVIYNVDTKHINIVDVDSFRILFNQPFTSKYLSSVLIASKLPNKYKVNPIESSGYIIPDQNSDIYCYAIMLLNFFYKDKFYLLDLNNVKKYLKYLKEIGFSKEFVEALSIPFSEKQDNIFLGDYLDEIDEDKISSASHTYFKKYIK